MTCDWTTRTMQFMNEGQLITLQGVQPPPLQLSSLSADQLLKCYKGNDIWAFALVTSLDSPPAVEPPAEIQSLLANYEDLFRTPTTLPPSRVHDHSIPLLLIILFLFSLMLYQSTLGLINILPHIKHKLKLRSNPYLRQVLSLIALVLLLLMCS